MNEDQKIVRRNEIRRRYGVTALPKDVERCKTTCYDPVTCYASGCEFARDMSSVLEPAE